VEVSSNNTLYIHDLIQILTLAASSVKVSKPSSDSSSFKSVHQWEQISIPSSTTSLYKLLV